MKESNYPVDEKFFVFSFLIYSIIVVIYGAGVYFKAGFVEKIADFIVRIEGDFLAFLPIFSGFIGGPLHSNLYAALTFISGFFGYAWLIYALIKSSKVFIKSPIGFSRQYLKKIGIENKLLEIIKYRVVVFISFVLSFGMFYALVSGNIPTMHINFITAIIFAIATAVAGPIVPPMLFLNISFLCHDIKTLSNFIHTSKGNH